MRRGFLSLISLLQHCSKFKKKQKLLVICQIVSYLSPLNNCWHFHYPQPEYRVVSEAISNFENEVARSLKSGVNRRCSFSVLFRIGGKGNDCPHKFYNLEDFDGALFSPEL